ncbi:MAG: hypothetical protein D8M59_05835 [Planctomycetes bacterium]|nr:hypothetical protein [Planctomycetota bacterium]NOG55897.1 hypothetical protein [Planctomycetota bacterium]
MMAFATDRDLLVPEPNLFRDMSFASQILAIGSDGTIGGTTFTSFTSNFTNVGIDAGHVIVVGGVALEVVSRLSATQLVVSRLRPDGNNGSLLPPTSGNNLTFQVCSYAPQIESVHALIQNACELHAVGSSGVSSSSYPEDQVVNPDEIVRVEVMGALYLAFAAAGSLTGASNAELAQRAELYRQRYDAARSAARVLIDTNGDGEAEIVRTMNTVKFFRN